MMMKKLSAQQSATKQKKGFTLTEIAIVLGIMGLILGAIWTAASSVYNNNRVGTANTEILTLEQGANSLYATQTSFGTAGTDLTAALATAGLSPQSLTTGTTIFHPWNGTSGVTSGNGQVTVTSNKINVDGDSIYFTFFNLPASACVALLTNISGVTGYYNATVAATAQASVTVPSASLGSGALTALTPVTAATANTKCAVTGQNPVTKLQLIFTKG